MQLMNKMYLFEREAGVGDEISMKAPYNEELQANNEYKKLRAKFGMWHGISMLVTLFCLGLLCYHMYFLAGQFSIWPTHASGQQHTQQEDLIEEKEM